MNNTDKTRAASDSAGVPTKAEGVVTRTVGGELVIYDPATTATHALDPVATAVFGAVDGSRTKADVAAAAAESLGTRVSSAQVGAALSDLADAGLVDYPAEGVGRRRFLTVGAAAGAMGVPTVLSVLAPSPAAAQSDDGGTGGTTGGGGSTDGGVVTTTTTIPPPPVGNVTTLAGSTSGNADGIGANAQFFSPFGVVVGNGGTLYVADSLNDRIRAINPDTGQVTTLAGSSRGYSDGTGASAQFNSPFGVTVGNGGTLYVADLNNNRIRAINPDTGQVTTLAGSSGGYVDGTGTAAQFSQPSGVAVGPTGTIYAVDSGNSRIRAINPINGKVTTLAGSGANSYADGPGATAKFDQPIGVAVGPAGTVYVADLGNHRIRAVDPDTGEVTTLAGSNPGPADGTGSSAQFSGPTGVAVGAEGTVYVADSSNSRIRVINPTTGQVTTLAGSSPGDADGTSTAAQFRFPAGVTVGPAGTVYVADPGNHRIRAIT